MRGTEQVELEQGGGGKEVSRLSCLALLSIIIIPLSRRHHRDLQSDWFANAQQHRIQCGSERVRSHALLLHLSIVWVRRWESISQQRTEGSSSSKRFLNRLHRTRGEEAADELVIEHYPVAVEEEQPYHQWRPGFLSSRFFAPAKRGGERGTVWARGGSIAAHNLLG